MAKSHPNIPWTEFSKLRREFAKAETIWIQVVAPALASRETARRQLVNGAIRRTAVFAAIAIFCWLMLAFLFAQAFGWMPIPILLALAVFIGFLAGFGGNAVAWIQIYQSHTDTKDFVLGAACEPFGFHYRSLKPDLSEIHSYRDLKRLGDQLQSDQGATLLETSGLIGSPAQPPTPAFDQLRKFDLLPPHKSVRFEDHISGERAGVRFDLVECVIKDSADDSETIVFRGVLLHFVYPRPFQGATVLGRKGWRPPRRTPGLEKVDLNVRSLSERFAVYGSDQTEARFLLSPDRIGRLMALESAFDTGHLRCVFAENTLSLALEGGDRFEAGSIFSPLVDPSRFQSALSELGTVCDLIDGVMVSSWSSKTRP